MGVEFIPLTFMCSLAAYAFIACFYHYTWLTQ